MKPAEILADNPAEATPPAISPTKRPRGRPRKVKPVGVGPKRTRGRPSGANAIVTEILSRFLRFDVDPGAGGRGWQIRQLRHAAKDVRLIVSDEKPQPKIPYDTFKEAAAHVEPTTRTLTDSEVKRYSESARHYLNELDIKLTKLCLIPDEGYQICAACGEVMPRFMPEYDSNFELKTMLRRAWKCSVLSGTKPVEAFVHLHPAQCLTNFKQSGRYQTLLRLALIESIAKPLRRVKELEAEKPPQPEKVAGAFDGVRWSDYDYLDFGGGQSVPMHFVQMPRGRYEGKRAPSDAEKRIEDLDETKYGKVRGKKTASGEIRRLLPWKEERKGETEKWPAWMHGKRELLAYGNDEYALELNTLRNDCNGNKRSSAEHDEDDDQDFPCFSGLSRTPKAAFYRNFVEDKLINKSKEEAEGEAWFEEHPTKDWSITEYDCPASKLEFAAPPSDLRPRDVAFNEHLFERHLNSNRAVKLGPREKVLAKFIDRLNLPYPGFIPGKPVPEWLSQWRSVCFVDGYMHRHQTPYGEKHVPRLLQSFLDPALDGQLWYCLEPDDSHKSKGGVFRCATEANGVPGDYPVYYGGYPKRPIRLRGRAPRLTALQHFFYDRLIPPFEWLGPQVELPDYIDHPVFGKGELQINRETCVYIQFDGTRERWFFKDKDKEKYSDVVEEREIWGETLVKARVPNLRVISKAWLAEKLGIEERYGLKKTADEAAKDICEQIKKWPDEIRQWRGEAGWPRPWVANSQKLDAIPEDDEPRFPFHEGALIGTQVPWWGRPTPWWSTREVMTIETPDRLRIQINAVGKDADGVPERREPPPFQICEHEQDIHCGNCGRWVTWRPVLGARERGERCTLRIWDDLKTCGHCSPQQASHTAKRRKAPLRLRQDHQIWRARPWELELLLRPVPYPSPITSFDSQCSECGQGFNAPWNVFNWDVSEDIFRIAPKPRRCVLVPRWQSDLLEKRQKDRKRTTCSNCADWEQSEPALEWCQVGRVPRDRKRKPTRVRLWRPRIRWANGLFVVVEASVWSM